MEESDTLRESQPRRRSLRRGGTRPFWTPPSLPPHALPSLSPPHGTPSDFLRHAVRCGDAARCVLHSAQCLKLAIMQAKDYNPSTPRESTLKSKKTITRESEEPNPRQVTYDAYAYVQEVSNICQSRPASLWIISRPLPVSRCQLESSSATLRRDSVSLVFNGSPGLVRHVWFVLLQTCHFCLHEFVIGGKLLAPSATRGPCCCISEPRAAIHVRNDHTPFLSGFSLAAFFSLGIDGSGPLTNGQ